MSIKSAAVISRRTHAPELLLSAEGLTVGALIGSGILFMGADQNPVQRAVICLIAMVGTLLDSAFDALVCILVHRSFLLLSVMVLVWPVSFDPCILILV